MDNGGPDREPTLGQVGEFAVIKGLTAGRRQPSPVLLGPGDDAAVVGAPDGRVVISTDMLVEGRHFRLDWSSPYDVGRKAIAQNAADIEAMGARVSAFVVGFGAPSDTPVRAATRLFDGMWEEAARLGASIVGGDMVAAPQWVVSVTVLGDLDGRAAVTRAGARPGCQVAVAGMLGASAAGLALLDAGVEDFGGLRRSHLVPEPPYGQGMIAARAGAMALTDISDGLIADARHVAAASAVEIALSAAALQPDVDALAAAADQAGADPWQWVLTGGEDHGLLGCFPDAVPTGWRVIGRVTPGAGRVLLDGAEPTGYAGWESFG
jgi:thiamine-monophosphate kinase